MSSLAAYASWWSEKIKQNKFSHNPFEVLTDNLPFDLPNNVTNNPIVFIWEQTKEFIVQLPRAQHAKNNTRYWPTVQPISLWLSAREVNTKEHANLKTERWPCYRQMHQKAYSKTWSSDNIDHTSFVRGFMVFFFKHMTGGTLFIQRESRGCQPQSRRGFFLFFCGTRSKSKQPEDWRSIFLSECTAALVSLPFEKCRLRLLTKKED